MYSEALPQKKCYSMKRLITIVLLAVLGLSPALQLTTSLTGGTEWCATASAKNKKKKTRKPKNKRQKSKAKKQKASLATVPHISSLVGSTARADKSLLSVTVPQGNKRIDYKAITVYFNRSLRIPSCVAYELTNTMVAMADAPDAEKRRNYKFNGDPNVLGSPDWGDYRKSGYTRGHMAPAMDMRWDRQAMTECFLMTNMCPQIEQLNNGPWRTLEESVHRWAKRDGSIWIYTGPIMAGSTRHIGPRADIAVPAAFYKVLYAPRQQRAIAFVYDNAAGEGGMARHATTIAEVEHRTGISFFPSMSSATARTLKRQCDLSQWR